MNPLILCIIGIIALICILQPKDNKANIKREMKYRTPRFSFTPDPLPPLELHEIFIFGSNTAGEHAGGAARVAVDKYGAQWGNGYGMQGQSYAIPTLDVSETLSNGICERVPIMEVANHILELYIFAMKKENEKKHFYMTKIGCGIAGFTIEEMKNIFVKYEKYRPHNVILPAEFVEEEPLSC